MDIVDEIIALERSALDRWITGDPQGYLDLYARNVTYFDPFRDKRVDGLEAMQTMMAPLKETKSPVQDSRYDMIDPKMERHSEVVLLTFNLVNRGQLAGHPDAVLARWNATEVYCRIDGQWKILHSHWSFVKPAVPAPSL